MSHTVTIKAQIRDALALAAEGNWLDRHLHCIREPDATPGEQAGQHSC